MNARRKLQMHFFKCEYNKIGKASSSLSKQVQFPLKSLEISILQTIFDPKTSSRYQCNTTSRLRIFLTLNSL